MKNSLRKQFCTCLLIAVISFGAFQSASAQDVAIGQATGTVQTALAVIAIQDLQFGLIFQGVSKTVPNNDAVSSGIFAITGAPGAGISTYMTLPQYISTVSGDDRMTIAFGNTDLSIDSTQNVDPSAFGDGWQDVDPNSIPNGLVIGSDAISHTMLFLGGKVIPSVNQTSGAYAGDIIVTVAYNGN